jgi:hypothetical protein
MIDQMAGCRMIGREARTHCLIARALEQSAQKIDICHEETGNPRSGAQDNEAESGNDSNRRRLVASQDEWQCCHDNERRNAALQISLEATLASTRSEPEGNQNEHERDRCSCGKALRRSGQVRPDGWVERRP